jgi:hypothetical protein
MVHHLGNVNVERSAQRYDSHLAGRLIDKAYEYIDEPVNLTVVQMVVNQRDQHQHESVYQLLFQLVVERMYQPSDY